MNTAQDQRIFRDERRYHGYNKHFGDTSKYRFHDALHNADQVLKTYFKPIAFLNGGLFECLDNHKSTTYRDGFTERSGEEHRARLPHKLFFGPTGGGTSTHTGLFQILSAYNFTIDENTATDQEIALDPELLGNIFEKLLDNCTADTTSSERKASGSFYTPREIVDYMVTQALRAYLTQRASSIPNVADRVGDILVRTDDATQKNLFNEQERKELVACINKLRIVDPAVGSGAFPMGILNALVHALSLLDPKNILWKEEQLSYAKEIPDSSARKAACDAIEKNFADGTDHDYGRKLYLIQHCIYGVDNKAIAIEIAKLRFFISLLVDEKIDQQADNMGIQPLPNLDFKLQCGDALLGLPSSGSVLLDSTIQEQLEQKKEDFFYESNHDNKKTLRDEIDDLFKALMQGAASFDKKYKNVHFDFKTHFSEVFRSQEGFDIVIANPPYIQLQKQGGALTKKYAHCNYSTLAKMGDICVLFYECGIQLLRRGAHLCYITTNKWMRAGYGNKLRAYLATHNPLQLLDFDGVKIFESATVDTNILMIQNTDYAQHTAAVQFDHTYTKGTDIAAYVTDNTHILSHLSGDPWIIASEAELALKEKIERVGVPLAEWGVDIYRGVTTGCNDAFIIDRAKRDALIARDPHSAEIIKPVLRGRDIKRYYADFAEEYLLFIPWHFPLHNDASIHGASSKAELAFKRQYPGIYQHLLQYKEKLTKRNTSETGIRYEWYALQRCASTYHTEFEKKKIVCSRMVTKPQFFCDKNKHYVTDTAYTMTGNHLKYLLAFLNSNLVYDIFHTFYSGGGIDGEIKIVKLIHLPIPKPSSAQEQSVTKLVNKIIAAKEADPAADTTPQENEIDQLVYQLYGLTKAEIALVEGKTKPSSSTAA